VEVEVEMADAETTEPMEVEAVEGSGAGGGAGAGGGSSGSKWHGKYPHVKKDQYGTPASAWQNVAHLLPAHLRIWEPFWMDGASGQYLRALGFTVHHENEDFFKIDKAGALQRGDIVVSNPPFSRKQELLRRLKDLGLPFVLILEDNVQATEYYHNIFGTDRPTVLSPQKRFGFVSEEGVQKAEGGGDGGGEVLLLQGAPPYQCTAKVCRA
jgi:hypothetical protein